MATYHFKKKITDKTGESWKKISIVSEMKSLIPLLCGSGVKIENHLLEGYFTKHPDQPKKRLGKKTCCDTSSKIHRRL